jgi:hypothetical protein
MRAAYAEFIWLKALEYLNHDYTKYCYKGMKIGKIIVGLHVAIIKQGGHAFEGCRP